MLEELKTFIAVVEHKNFTKAGNSINLSQPSVSLHIKNLEEHFETTLVSRSIKQKKIIITESGHLLYKRAKEILELYATTRDEVKNVSNTFKGNLRIGASFTIGECILPKLLADFCLQYPDIHVELIIENSTEITDKVKSLNIDIGLIEGLVQSSNFDQHYFLDDNLVLILSKHHELADTPFSYEQLQNQRWVSREIGSGTHEYLSMFLTAHHIIPKSIMILGSNYAVKEAVKNSLGITIASSYLTASDSFDSGIVSLPLPENYTRPLSYIVPKDFPISKTTDLFIQFLLEFCK